MRLVVALAGGLGRGVEEDRGLEPLAADAEERRRGRPPRADVERLVEAALELARRWSRAAVRIQNTMPVTKPTAMIDGDPADELLLLEGQLAGAVGEQRRRGRPRATTAAADPEPDVLQRVPPVRLDEERGEDDDDECRFEAFAQPDEGVAHKHRDPPVRRSARGRIT